MTLQCFELWLFPDIHPLLNPPWLCTNPDTFANSPASTNPLWKTVIQRHRLYLEKLQQANWPLLLPFIKLTSSRRNRIGNINRWNNKQKHEGCEGSGNRTKGFLDPGNVWILEQDLEREREKAKEEDKGSHRLILTIPPSQHSDEIQAWTIIPGCCCCVAILWSHGGDIKTDCLWI